MDLFVLLCTGAVSGLIAGLVGLAGGIVVVPVLTWMYGAGALHDAIVISWFSVLFNSIGAAAKQYRIRTPAERHDLFRRSRLFLLGAIVVTPGVALTLSGARHLVTPALVATLQLCLAAVMLWPVAESQGEQASNRVLDMLFGGLIGGASTLIGVGGGTYTIAYFVYAAKSKFQDAIATANVTGLVIGALSVAGYLLSFLKASQPVAASNTSPISALGMVILIAAGIVFSPLGVRLSRRLRTPVLRKILVGALILSALRLMLA